MLTYAINDKSPRSCSRARDISRKHLQLQQETAKQKLLTSKKIVSVVPSHQEHRGCNINKNRVEDRVEGTYEWFLGHNNFRKWLKQEESGPVLVSADPGCGKSVLTKYLIDRPEHRAPSTLCTSSPAVLPEAFTAIKPCDENGPGLINSTNPLSLWTILGDAVRDPEAGPVIIVLDALDECDASELADLVRNVSGQFRSSQLGYGKLKYILTSRPYEQIESKFQALSDCFPQIRIPGGKSRKKLVKRWISSSNTESNGCQGRKCYQPK
ncbi:hypothetical protein BDBG_16383 [Blastomyces gilchristii SLH14081]|uniref:Nephrocystin 3-like N-terminal domain-containing protein n=1 Tax=Blastomyces gilchristii (strain SLH14081) TaxID=559298 RepID=A0A179UCX3_BLAGS|nr:uncharacterized protein BDBG_16383 [Blastomyces gilchristii SLH14081]OAT05007.1 hypothetical protein BDBG_16383 [Blastomyces gilchristii SLH14081]